MRSYRKFKFVAKGNSNHLISEVDITIAEIVDPQYGLFTWPSAPVLAQFIFYHQVLVRNKKVLELGCGTALAGLVAAKLGSQVYLSDGHDYTNCLDNCKKSCDLNKLEHVTVLPITWGSITKELLDLNHVDIIIASDCFYDKKDFEDILFTISFMMEKNPGAVFWTTYQLRSCSYSIEHLLLKWNLKSREIPLSEFDADGLLVGNSDMSAKHQIQMIEISSNK